MSSSSSFSSSSSSSPHTYRALVEDQTPLRIQPHRQHRGQHRAAAAPQRVRLLRHRDGVQVDDRVQQLGAGHCGVLQRHPAFERAEIVAEVRDAGGLDAGEDDSRLAAGVAGR